MCAACADATAPTRLGILRISARTTGGDPDDAYDVLVGERRLPVRGNANFLLVLEPGEYNVALDGVAQNCIQGDANPHAVNLVSRDTVYAAFTVDCATTGIEIKTRTTGPDNPSSYDVVVDERPPVAVGVNSLLTIGRLQPGAHTVALKLPGENCTLQGPGQLDVDVTNRSVISLEFEIGCAPPVRAEKIAYTADTVDSNNYATTVIALVKLDGSGDTRFGFGQSPSWSPDGLRMVFSTTQCDFYYGCNGTLVIADPETHNTATLKSGFFPITPAWSPSGNLIAFVDRPTERLFLISPDSARAVQVQVTGLSRVRNPAWSPDGQRIVAGCVLAPTNYDICTFAKDGSGLIQLTTDPYADVEPKWSPDNLKIIFSRSIVVGGSSDLMVMNADGSGVTKLTEGSTPTWSPDGTKIIFARLDGLFSINVDGSNLTQLTKGRHYAPAWRP
jgi:hypothetical protein